MTDEKQKSLLQRLSLEVLLVAALFLAAFFVFAYITRETVYEQEAGFDTQVHTFLQAHSTPAIIAAARCFTFLGSDYFLLPGYVLLTGTLMLYQKKYYALRAAVIGLSSFLMMQLLKHVFHRKRPDLPLVRGITSYSFPSGHALSSFVFCSILAYLVWASKWIPVWKWLLTILLLLLAVAIGMSRIVLNVHYATDVIAGFCLGVMWVIASFWVIQKIEYRRPPRL